MISDGACLGALGLGCAGEIGAVLRMKESNNKGVATHVGSESWAGTRKGADQALTGGRAGWVIEPRKPKPAGRAADVWSADLFQVGGRPRRRRRFREASMSSTRSENPCMRGCTATGNREIPRLPARAGRIGKSKDASR